MKVRTELLVMSEKWKETFVPGFKVRVYDFERMSINYVLFTENDVGMNFAPVAGHLTHLVNQYYTSDKPVIQDPRICNNVTGNAPGGHID